MKNLWRRFSGSQEDQPDNTRPPKGPKSRFFFSDAIAPPSTASLASDSKRFHRLSGLINVAKHTLHQAGSLKKKKEGSVSADGEQNEQGNEPSVDKHKFDLEPPSITESMLSSDRRGKGTGSRTMSDGELHFAAKNFSVGASGGVIQRSASTEVESRGSPLLKDAISKESPGLQRAQTAETAALQRASNQAVLLQDEELQVRVAMALSVRDDPEAATIEAMKDVSLGSNPLLSNSTAHLLAYRYWKYNSLSYEDKIVDGFYDVYKVVADGSEEEMPSLAVLQETPVSKQAIWEAILVNRAADRDLANLEQKAISLASSCESVAASDWKRSEVINKIAEMVADQMGGPVEDAELLLENWRSSSAMLKLSLKNVVLPLGSLLVGLGRHRALLFKVLADAVGIPCQLLKGKQYTGDDEAAVNILKVEAGREFIIDLMAIPGSLIPYDASSIGISRSKTSSVSKEPLPSLQGLSKSGKDIFAGDKSHGGVHFREGEDTEVESSQEKVQKSEFSELEELHGVPAGRHVGRPATLRRSPSWTEGVGLPSARNTKVQDVSQYMIDAAKGNPSLAQKIHDVLLESGIQAPLNLFDEISPHQLQAQTNEDRKGLDESHRVKAGKGDGVRRRRKSSVGPGRPVSTALPSSTSSDEGKLQRLNSVEGLGERRPLDFISITVSSNSSPNSSASSAAATVQSSSTVLPASSDVSLVQEILPVDLMKSGPVAAAAATAAVVASSMLVAAAKSDLVADTTLDVPVAAAATATAAVVAATRAVAVTSAAVGRRLELQEEISRRHEEADDDQPVIASESLGSGSGVKSREDERVSDKSSESMSAKSDRVLDDVAEWAIPWEELVIGERIGLGSYGEVYRGDWHGTEVAVKKFLDQDITGDALVEFGTEVRLMKRMRHPNVVLFMGAVMRAPNLSIVTEFLPRGSLYRLIHRSNSQLDERRRMRMALDVARGMNYLHSCTPAIVHRDLKSPNLLVDKNWVVKVCDFGLSRIKNNTFLSSKSTAGTPEWMAPEVLRNEPSNEKSDVYSFGVILWELATLQQPWGGMNPMQVVGAVGFQHRILDIPDSLDPVIVSIIRQCWRSDPALRPSFADIMNALKPLQKPITQSQIPKR